MQFRHPEILYTLFLLLIPIIVHLFQLRKFQKVPFTNVQFLKEVIAQTRKSSQLKKWLILSTRLLALAALVIAFAQPFFSKTNTFEAKKENVIYIDNSFSMQAKGTNGELYKRAVQELLGSISETEEFTLFSNDFTYTNTTVKAIQNELLQTGYSAKGVSLKDAILKGKSLFSKDLETEKNLVLISDFQLKNEALSVKNDSLVNIELVQLSSVSKQNISLDSLSINNSTSGSLELTVHLKNQGNAVENIPVSLFNGDKLIAKTSLSMEENSESTTSFPIPEKQVINGTIGIDDPNLQFDNNLYFTINEPQKINVLSINNADAVFLEKIYTPDEFIFTSVNFDRLNYNEIEIQDLIILNELSDIPVSLQTALRSFTTNGGKVLIIPSQDIDLSSYNSFTRLFGGTSLQNPIKQEKRITTINFSHPLLDGVFDKRISNFQYPKVNSFYALGSNVSAVLKLEDDRAFLSQLSNNGFLFSAAINQENSNFKNSPLIVPVLYNIARQSLQLPLPYYTVGAVNNFDVPVTIAQDEILTLNNENANLIPLQQVFSNRVRVTTTDIPSVAGTYQINQEQGFIQNVSYNYDRSEAVLQYQDMNKLTGVRVSDGVSNLFEKLQTEYTISALWKWFAIFAAVFLLMEMLILKFFK